MALQESGEMYLETILTLKQKNQYVRSIDVANALNYTKPSVSRGMKLLKEAHLIVIDSKGYIDFTEDGLSKAKEVLERHEVLMSLLTHIGVSEEQAETDACRIEHVISSETFESIKKYMNKQS